MTERAPVCWYCTECAAVATHPGPCPECGVEMRPDDLSKAVPQHSPFHRFGSQAFIPSPDEGMREADRIVELWSRVKANRDASVARVRAKLVGKEVGVPFAPSSGWAVDPKLQCMPPPRWCLRMVLDVVQPGQQVSPMFAVRQQAALNITLPSPRALVLGIDQTRPTVWAPLPWLRISA